MSGIFADSAPAFWAAGLPVIPLHKSAKRPIHEGWSVYCQAMPNELIQRDWLAGCAEGNIGLPLGPQSGIIVVDVDTRDPALQKIITDLIPDSPWRRIGEKGVVMAFRYAGERHKWAIRDVSGKTIVEMLTLGQQVVLPPSIHPDTKRPYVENVPLLSVLSQLPELPKDVEGLLRVALVEEGKVQLQLGGRSNVSEFVSTGSRFDKMKSMAGVFELAVSRGERSLLEATNMLRSWHAELTEHVAGDDIDIEDGVRLIVKYLHNRVTGPRRAALPKGWDAGLSEEDKKRLGAEFGVEHEEWSYEEIVRLLKDDFSMYPGDENEPKRMEGVNKTLERIVRSRNLTILDEDRLLDFLAKQSALGLTKATLKKQIAVLRQNGISGANHTEIAEALVKDMGDLRFDSGQFWQWKGDHWQPFDVADLQYRVASDYGALPSAKKFSDHVQIVKLIAGMVRRPLAETPMAGVNFANGFLTTDLQLLTHSPDFGCTYVMPFRYMPDAAPPERFLKFMESCWVMEEDFGARMDALQEAICVTLFGEGPKYMRAVELYGLAETGKSQLLTIIGSLVPEGTTSSVPPDQWADKFAPAQLAGKLLNFGGELSENKMIDGQKFKEIVDGTQISAQHKNQQIFPFKPKAMHWFGGNYLPKTRDTTEGFNRRWLILTFNQVVSREDRVPLLGESIAAAEREQIVAWAVRARDRLERERGYTLPACHRRAINEMAEANDSVRFFFAETKRVRIVPVSWSVIQGGASPSTPESSDGSRIGHLTLVGALHDEYCTFCAGQVGVKPVGLRLFKTRIREIASLMGFRVTTTVTANGWEELACDGVMLTDAAGKARPPSGSGVTNLRPN